MYGGVPPVGPVVAVPSQKPLHETGVLLMFGTMTALGSIVKVKVVSQPFASVSETE